MSLAERTLRALAKARRDEAPDRSAEILAQAFAEVRREAIEDVMAMLKRRLDGREAD